MHIAGAKAAVKASGMAIPDKIFYKIGEVSRITGVEPYVLRYWETEFPFLQPRKSKSGQRIYSRKDLDLILEIKSLLYGERYTLEGVRKKLGMHGPLKKAPTAKGEPVASPVAAAEEPSRPSLARVKGRLRDLIERLS